VGSDVAARHLPLDAGEREELARLRAGLREDLRRSGAPRLNARGRAAVENGDFPTTAAALEGPPAEALELVDSGELVVLVQAEMLVLERDERRRLERYADLQRRWDRGRIALFIEPLPAPS
jgi:hypothetical protein